MAKKTTSKSFFDDVRASRTPAIADRVSLGVLVMVLFFGGLFAWSILAPLPTGAVVAGSVIADGNRDQIKHSVGGIMDEVFVKTGDRVKKGDPLVSLKSLSIDAKARQISAEIFLNELKYNRLLAELENADEFKVDIDVPHKLDQAVVDRLIEAEYRLFQSRKAAFQSEVKAMKTSLSVAEMLKPNLEKQLKNVKRQYNLIRKELSSMKGLAEKGYISQSQKLELDRRSENLMREQHQITSQISDQEKQLSSAEAGLAQIQADRYRATLEEIKQTTVELESFKANLEVVTDERQRTILRAPKDGFVMNFNQDTPETVIQAGELIMEILPADSKLVVDGKLAPKDGGNVHVGMIARVSILAFPTRTTPSLEGEVIYISPDVNADEQSGQSYYQVKIAILDKTLREIDQSLQPGYPAQAILESAKQPILIYLLSPLLSSIDKAFVEN